MTIRPLPEINSGTGRPWRCKTHETHECAGPVVGAVGAIPCCATGAVAEEAAQDADRARLARWMAENADELEAEARREQEWERRVS